MIHIILKVKLKPPFKKSFQTLLDFCNVWRSSIISGGTNKTEAQISIPYDKFEKLFEVKPKISKYKVPKGAEFFITETEVVNIRVDKDKNRRING